VVPGVITANSVDVTADDGSLMAERLGVGDMVYIVLKPKSERKGWVRISRSADDTVGIGWVEAKNTQRFAEYQATGAKPAKRSPEAAVPVTKTARLRIAVLPFKMSNPKDSFGRGLLDGFLAELKTRKQVEIVNNVPSQGVNVESPEEVRPLFSSYRLDGVFVGTLSDAIGGNRLLQVKYLGKEGETFAFEKIRRLPVSGNARQAMKEFAETCADSLFSL
jgi:hypothetical protein